MNSLDLPRHTGRAQKKIEKKNGLCVNTQKHGDRFIAANIFVSIHTTTMFAAGESNSVHVHRPHAAQQASGWGRHFFDEMQMNIECV